MLYIFSMNFYFYDYNGTIAYAIFCFNQLTWTLFTPSKVLSQLALLESFKLLSSLEGQINKKMGNLI